MLVKITLHGRHIETNATRSIPCSMLTIFAMADLIAI